MSENENEAANRRAARYFWSWRVISVVAETDRVVTASAQEATALRAYEALVDILHSLEEECAAASLSPIHPPPRRIQEDGPVEPSPEVNAQEVGTMWPVWPEDEPFPLTAEECLYLLKGYAIKPQSGPMAIETFERLPKRLGLLNDLLYPCLI